MCRKTFIVLLLCVAMLFSGIASAQESIWSQQKIAIASIADKTERGLDENYKRSIYNKIRDVLVTNFDTFEVNIDDVKNQLRASNLPPSPQNIRKKIGERGADFIVFTEIRATSSAYDAYNANAQIIIVLSQHRIATGKEVSRTITVSPTRSAITDGVGQLISELFGVSTSGQSASQNTFGSQPAQSTHQYSSYNQSQSSYAKTYKVGDYYDANGKQGVVFAVTPDGKHGKIVGLNNLGRMNWNSAVSACSNLGNGWRLPSKEELLAIYKVKSTLNSTLAAVGDGLPEDWLWSSTECRSDRAWRVYMDDGIPLCDDKGNNFFYARAVSAF